MARRARMLALLQLSSLVFLLVVELSYTAPVSDGSSINNIPSSSDDGNEIFSEKHDGVAYTATPSENKHGESVVQKNEDDAGTVQDSDSVSEENVDMHEEIAVKSEDNAAAVQGGNSVSKEDMDKNENLNKDGGSISTKTEDHAGAAEEDKKVSEENTDEHKDSVSTRSEDDEVAVDGSAVVSEENVDNDKDSVAPKIGEDSKTAEDSNANLEENSEKHNHTSTEDKELTDSVSEESVERHEDSMATKTEEHTSDAESEEYIDKIDHHSRDVAGEVATIPERENGSIPEENMDKYEAKAIEDSDDKSSKEQIETLVAANEGDEDSEESVEVFKDKNVDAVESTPPDKGTEENKEDKKEVAEGTVLKKEDVSEELPEEDNRETESELDVALGRSSEETSDVEDEAEYVEANENHSSAHQENHDVTSSPFSQLRVPPSDDHHIEKVDEQGNKDAAVNGQENHNPSVEETAEKEAGSPDELIEHDRVDSEVIRSDNKTAAMGRSMPMEDAENKDESDKTEKSLEDTKEESETAVVLKELEHSEEKVTNNENEEEKVESEKHKGSENKHEAEPKEALIGGKVLDEEEEEENEKDNFLDKDDELPKGPLDHSSEDELDVDEKHLVTETHEEEGSGIPLGVVELVSHNDDAHKDASETSIQEKHDAESNDKKEEKKENKNEHTVVSEETKTSEEIGPHIGGFEDSGSGNEEDTKESLEKYGYVGKPEDNGTEDVEDGAGSGSHALEGDYKDAMNLEEHNISSVSHLVPILSDSEENSPILSDSEESSTEYHSESTASEVEVSTKEDIFGKVDDQSGDHHLKEENLAQNGTNVQVMSMGSTPVPEDSNDHHAFYEGSGDDEGNDTTTPLPIYTDMDDVLDNILQDLVDDNMAVSGKEIDVVNNSMIGQASHAYQEKPVEKVISPQLAAAPLPPTTEAPCKTGEENKDCLHHSNISREDEVTNILEDDDEVPPVPTKAGIHSKSSDYDMKELEVVISTTPVVKVLSEEESSQRSITIDLNEPLHSKEEVSSTTIAPGMQEITESIEDHEDVDNEAVINGAPDTNVEQPFGETGIKQMSGEIRVANVNEIGVSGQGNSDDLGEPEALDSSNASGSYVVLGCIMAVVVVLLAYAAIKSRRERGANTSSKKQSEVAGDDDDGTELKDMKKALLPPETPHEDRNGDIEANRKPLMDKDENQEEDEDKEPIIKQNGTLELSEPPKDIESQLDSSPAEGQLKMAQMPNTRGASPNKPQQRNGLSEVVVEKPALSNGKQESIITHPVAAKVKVIENEDSIAKTPVIINRGGNSPPH